MWTLLSCFAFNIMFDCRRNQYTKNKIIIITTYMIASFFCEIRAIDKLSAIG